MARVGGFFSGVWRRLVEGAGRARGDAWPIVQGAGAAGVAWFLAHTVLGHSQPTFAPIAAVAALAVNVGERGVRTIGMLVGVVVGIVVGEAAVYLFGTSLLEVTLVVGIALLVTRALISSIIGLIQSGASAAIVIVAQSTASGSERLLDALIGGAVALLVSQVLFPPSPHALLANAGREALDPIAEGLRASVRALAGNDAAEAEAALEHLREGLGSLDDLAEARDTSGRVSRRTLRGWWEKDRYHLDELDARLGEADLLCESALLLARATRRLLDERIAAPEWLSQAADNLARGAEALAEGPEGPSTRHQARESALEAEHALSSDADLRDADHRVALVVEGVRVVAFDILRVAGFAEPK